MEKRGDVASRLLQEAVLYCEGIHGLIKIADENANVHPMLYLAAMKEYDKNHEYSQIEAIGHNAVKKIDCNMVIRSKIALKAAFAADYLGHTEEMMSFCWEGFRSDFQRWKLYFPMEQQEREAYLSWAEKIVYSRADAIVGGQHRNHYGQSAQLLAIVGEIKESMGKSGAKKQIFAEYKRKFPRHSSFQREMKTYFQAF